MKQLITIFICSIFSVFLSNYSCELPTIPSPGSRLWDNAIEDLMIDITTLSRICVLSSGIEQLTLNNDAIISEIAIIQSLEDEILSEISLIDTKTNIIESNLNNIYHIDQTILSNMDNIYLIDQTINSKLDDLIRLDDTILSKVMVIDTRTSSIQSNVTNIFSLDQIIDSKITMLNNIDQTILSKVMVIDTRTSNIASSVTNIYNLDQSINSKVDTMISLDQRIYSTIPSVSTCCTFTSVNQAFTSIYGESISENRLDNISIQFQYGIPSSTTTSYTQGGGTITTSGSMAVLSTAASTTSIAQLQSIQNIGYRSGHNAYAIFTVAFTGSFTATSSQFIGPIDYQNGFAIGFDGNTFGITMRNNTVNTFIPQSSFNGDKLDGTGASQFNYQRALLNVFRIDYGYIGSSVIQFRVMGSTGNWITFHTIQYPNGSSQLSIRQPFLPITARVENLTGNSILTLRTAGWNAGIIGSPNFFSYRYFQANNTVTGIPAGADRDMFVIRNSTVFNNQPNHIPIRITVTGMIIDTAGTGAASFTLIKNGTITGTTFTDISTGNSVVQVALPAFTYTASTGTVVFTQTNRSIGFMGMTSFPSGLYDIILYPGETLLMRVNSVGGNDIYGCVAWEEQF